MIIKGVNCPKTRSICYRMAIPSTFGCLMAILVQLMLMSSWENNDMAQCLFLFAAGFVLNSILLVRSFCVPVPIPITTKDSHQIGEGAWFITTVVYMFLMFNQSYNVHRVYIGIYAFGVVTGAMSVKQLNWPAQDIYIQHVIFTVLLCCVSGIWGYQRPDGPAFFAFFAFLCLISTFVNRLLAYVIRPPPSRAHDLNV